MSVVVLCVCQHLKSSLMLNEDHFMDWNERCCFVCLSTFEKLINAERGLFYGLKWALLFCVFVNIWSFYDCVFVNIFINVNEDYFMDWNERCCFVYLSTFEKLCVNAERGLFYGLIILWTEMSVVVLVYLSTFEKLINAERGSFYGLKWALLFCVFVNIWKAH